ncbi:MAG: hydrolase [Bryobacterales bacterium]|nr:hydrolase [Bryobacterales bacterium]
MSRSNGRRQLSEKGLLTPDNCVVALIDLQPQMLFGVANFDRQAVINNNLVLAKAARVFDVPAILSTVETRAFSGNFWPQILSVFPGQGTIERTTMNCWDDANFLAAIEKIGRKKIVLAGLWTETCVALPTVQAIHDGYEVYVVEDCCGDVSQLAHDNAMTRVVQAGAKPVTALSVMLEWQRDWGHRETYDAVMDIVKTHCGAYGAGVEYAYTMVHGAAATRVAEYNPPVAAAAHK